MVNEKKKRGKQLSALNNVEYLKMLADTARSGVNSPASAVLRYFSRLREYAVNRFKWHIPQCDDVNAFLIEYYLFYYGYCAILRPSITRRTVRIYSSRLEVHPCNISRYNRRTGEAYTIVLTSPDVSERGLDVLYTAGDFVLITAGSSFLTSLADTSSAYTGCCCQFAYETANKLYELDLLYTSNITKQRLPVVVNTANKALGKGQVPLDVAVDEGGAVSELLRSAVASNANFAAVPSTLIGRDGLLHEMRIPADITSNVIHTQGRLYDQYFEMLGFSSLEERRGAYVDKDSQDNGHASADYIVQTLIEPRRTALARIAAAFGVVGSFGIFISV